MSRPAHTDSPVDVQQYATGTRVRVAYHDPDDGTERHATGTITRIAPPDAGERPSLDVDLADRDATYRVYHNGVVVELRPDWNLERGRWATVTRRPAEPATDGGSAVGSAASHGELKRRIATMLGTDPGRYAADLGTERHRRLTDAEISAICERLGLDDVLDADNQARRDAIMRALDRDHRLGIRLWDSSDLLAVIDALDGTDSLDASGGGAP